MDNKTRNLAIGLAVTLLALVAFGLIVAGLAGGTMHGDGPGMMGDWSWGFPRWGMMLGGGLMMLLFWVAVIGGLVWLVVSIAQRGSPSDSRQEESSLETLKRRYARGEIDQETYERMKREIE